MVETIFPPASNWYMSKILSSREDGSVAYGSQNSVFMMKIIDGKIKPILILNAHKERVTSVSFSPTNHYHQCQDLLVSSSDDGFVKLWNIGSQTPVVAHNSHTSGRNNVKVVCASWSPCNHQYIVSAGENDTLVLWNIIANTTTRFLFSKLQPSVMECSYHDEKVVAVGCKNGLVYIIRLVGKGETIHRLRGHDKEVQGLSWNPIPFDNEMSNRSKCLLATSCQEKDVYIWQGDEGQCVARIQLPKNAFIKRDFYNAKWEPTLNFTPVFWSSPNRLYAVDKFNELICCDPVSVIQTETLNVAPKDHRRKVVADIWRLVHALHSQTIFAISGVPIKIEALNSEAAGGAGSSGNFSTLQIHPDQSHLENNLSSDTSSSHSSDSGTENQEFETPRSPNASLIWTVGKDQKLIAIKKDSAGEPEFCLNTINGNPYIIRESPHDPSFVGIGAGDGKIRLWNVSRSSGQARTFPFKINDRVYSLAWHPLKESFLAFGTSEGKIGIIDVYSQKPPLTFPAKHNGKVYCLSWGPTFFEDGQRILPDKKRLSLYSVGGNKILWHNPKYLSSEPLKVQTSVPCKKFVDLRWKADYSVLAVGSRKGYIYILRPPLFDVICLASAASKCIMSLTWHPRSTDLSELEHTGFDGYLTFASIDKDRVIKVYNYTEEPDSYNIQVVSVLRGHNKSVQFVSWNPHVSGQIISSSSDYTVRIWDVRTSTQLLQLRASEGVLPLCCFWDPIDPNVIIAGFSERILLTWKISKSAQVEPTLKVITLDRGIKFNIGELMHEPENLPRRNNNATFVETVEEVLDRPIESEANNSTQTDQSDSDDLEDDLKMFLEDSLSESVAFQNYCELLRTPEEDLLQISFFESESELSAFIELEDDNLPRQSLEHRRYQIAHWTGNLRSVLEERVAKGEVDDYLIALAPYVSPELWREACECYAKKLVEKRYYRKAATYLLNIDKIHEAVDMLVKVNLFSEAICIARCRLPRSDPTFSNTLRKYAQLLDHRKQVLKSAECYLVLQDYAEAAKVLARKNNAEHLSLAAATAQKGGLRDLEVTYSYRGLLLSLETHNFNLATQIAKDHPEIKVLTLLSETCQLLYKLDNGMASLEKDIITHIREITGIENDANVYGSLKHTYDKKKSPLQKKIMYLILAFEVSLACCAAETDIFLTHIIRAMEITTKPLVKDTDGIPRVFKLSLWLCPPTATDYLSRDTIFGWDDANVLPKITSLRAYFCLGIAELMSNVLHHKTPPVGNMTEYCILLEKLINDALDKDTFTYYRNQVDIKSVYTTINEACKRKRERKNSENSNAEAANKNVPECLAKYLKDALELDSVEVSEDDIIASETEKMRRMTAQMENFETSRISSPDPSNIYVKLWEVLEAIEETEILNKIEKKLEELDWHDKF